MTVRQEVSLILIVRNDTGSSVRYERTAVRNDGRKRTEARHDGTKRLEAHKHGTDIRNARNDGAKRVGFHNDA